MSGSVFDPRILKIEVQIGNVLNIYEDDGVSFPGYGLTARGTKYANPIQNECEVEIFNLAADEKNYILTQTSPFNQNNQVKSISVYAGRVSTGYALVFTGDITNVSVKQPPDVALTLKSATLQFTKSLVGSNKYGNKVHLSQVASDVANSLGVQLNFQATDKQIANYAFTGSQLKQVDKLNDLGSVNAYIDDNTLVVKNANLPLPDANTIINLNTGMVGIPEVTEEGVEVSFLFNNSAKLGGSVSLSSVINPSVDGDYTIFKLEFDLANRDTNFYYKATCINSNYSGTVAGNDQSQLGGNQDNTDSDDE